MTSANQTEPVEAVLTGFDDRRSNLIPILQTIQDFVRWKDEGRLMNYKPAGYEQIDGGIAAVSVSPRIELSVYHKGSDNVIAFTTHRYSQTPLVVQGPGAGADVTAMGVFSDILKLLHYLPY